MEKRSGYSPNEVEKVAHVKRSHWAINFSIVIMLQMKEAVCCLYYFYSISCWKLRHTKKERSKELYVHFQILCLQIKMNICMGASSLHLFTCTTSVYTKCGTAKPALFHFSFLSFRRNACLINELSFKQKVSPNNNNNSERNMRLYTLSNIEKHYHLIWCLPICMSRTLFFLFCCASSTEW